MPYLAPPEQEGPAYFTLHSLRAATSTRSKGWPDDRGSNRHETHAARRRGQSSQHAPPRLASTPHLPARRMRAFPVGKAQLNVDAVGGAVDGRQGGPLGADAGPVDGVDAQHEPNHQVRDPDEGMLLADAVARAGIGGEVVPPGDGLCPPLRAEDVGVLFPDFLASVQKVNLSPNEPDKRQDQGARMTGEDKPNMSLPCPFL